MPTITFIGGGSAKFVSELIRDVFTYDSLKGSCIRLMDIDAERLDRGKRIVQRTIDQAKVPARVETYADRKEAVRGADFVVVTIMSGGFKHYKSDAEIPMQYGVLPTVGDTIGPGGVFRLIRTEPVLAGLAEELAEVAPNAWILNYSNPMAMNTWALHAAGHKRTVGLCHSIQGMYRHIAGWLGIPADEVRYTAAGINHINFYLTLTHNGRDLYPDLLAKEQEIVAKQPQESVRFELLRHIGYWPAEGAEHQSEYYPWFRKNPEIVATYGAETMWGYNFDFKLNGWLLNSIEDQIAGRKPICFDRGHEYGAGIIDGLVSGTESSFYGNVPNEGLIDNLPRESVVEVPCLVNANGIFPCRMGRIPPQLAAVMTPHIHVHQMALEGVRRRDRELIRLAIQADPLTGAICTLPQIHKMVDDLFAENAAWMRHWPQQHARIAV